MKISLRIISVGPPIQRPFVQVEKTDVRLDGSLIGAPSKKPAETDPGRSVWAERVAAVNEISKK